MMYFVRSTSRVGHYVICHSEQQAVNLCWNLARTGKGENEELHAYRSSDGGGVCPVGEDPFFWPQWHFQERMLLT